MRSERVEFHNAHGRRLAARLERPEGTPRAWAVFAHCFTCDKTSKAAVRISRALADAGIATLRFDFTGLGESEGEFGGGFSADVADLLAAAAYLRGLGGAPGLLVGHSLGGAAVLAAAGQIPEVRAVATIAAPFHPEHVLRLLGDGVARIEADGEAEISIGARPFRLTRAFVEDVRAQTPAEKIAHLRRALLVLHSPVDDTVSVDEAAAIFTAARHPKSFVSLDRADHLLTDPDDAEYAARMIASWSSRYLGAAADVPIARPDAAVTVEETGAGKFQVQVTAGTTRFYADEPLADGGLGSGPTPYELLAAGLGACTAMTTRMYADFKGLPLERVRVAVRHEKREDQTPKDLFHREIAFDGPLEPAQVAKLFEIAGKCPVHRTLEGGARVETGPLAPPAPLPPEVVGGEDEHFHDMEAACQE
jgi:putative redox protein